MFIPTQYLTLECPASLVTSGVVDQTIVYAHKGTVFASHLLDVCTLLPM